MAKRKRLTPALLGGTEQALTGGAETIRERPPIARVAGETATEAAFAEVAGALASAREEGRLIVKLPLDTIETGHLVRDRITFDPDEMAALEASLRARGQQVPVEVVPLDEAGHGEGQGRYGLISGLRRVMALRAIGAGEVLALVRQPDSSAEAYLAMVEENEIRAGISFYERARLASEAVRLELYPDASSAIAALFSSASPAKRSKIGSFVRLHEALGSVLRYPTAIPERLGLALAGVIDRDPKAVDSFVGALEVTKPTDATTERAVLEAVLTEASKGPRKAANERKPNPSHEIVNGIRMEARRGRVILSGPGVTEALKQGLKEWLTKLS